MRMAGMLTNDSLLRVPRHPKARLFEERGNLLIL